MAAGATRRSGRPESAAFSKRDLAHAAQLASAGDYLAAGLSIISRDLPREPDGRLAKSAVAELKRMDTADKLKPLRKHPVLGPHVDAIADKLATWRQAKIAGQTNTPSGVFVCPNTGRTQVHISGGAQGSWPKELNNRALRPNADYHVNGYLYKTDDQGRVVSVEGKLKLNTADRNAYQQKISGRDDRRDTDQGGHLIATIFDGPGDRLNLVPMDGNFNMGRWKAMENTFAEEAKKGDVHVKIDIFYPPSGGRPLGFNVQSKTVSGKTNRRFRNRPGG